MIVFEKFDAGSMHPAPSRIMFYTPGNELENKTYAGKYWGFTEAVLRQYNTTYTNKEMFHDYYERFNRSRPSQAPESNPFWCLYWKDTITENEFGVVSP